MKGDKDTIMVKQKSLKLNFIMNSILTMSSFVFPIITFPYVSRTLLAEGVGRVSFATSVISYFLMIAQLGIPTYGVRVCAQVRDNKELLSKTVHEIFFINIFMTIISYCALIVMVIAVPRFSSDKMLYFIVSFNILFNTIGMEWLFKALEQYSYITIRSIIFKFIALLGMLLLIHQPDDYYVYAGLTIFASSGSSILNFIRVGKYISFHKFENYDLKKHMKGILIFFSMSCATTIYTNLDSVMLGFMMTDTDVGYYVTSIKIKNILASVVSSLGVVLLPRMSYYIQNNMKTEFEAIIKKAINFVFVVSCPLVVYFTLFSKECVLFLAGNGFENSILPMQIIMPTLLFIGLTNIMGIQVLVPLGQEKKVLYSEIVGAFVDFVFNLIFIPIYGCAGAAMGTLLAEVSVFVFQFFVLKSSIKDSFKSVSYVKIITALIISVIVSIWAKLLPFGDFLILVISALCYFVAYGVVLLLLREKFVVSTIKPYIERLRKKKE